MQIRSDIWDPNQSDNLKGAEEGTLLALWQLLRGPEALCAAQQMLLCLGEQIQDVLQ